MIAHTLILDEFHPRIEKEIRRIERNLIESLTKTTKTTASQDLSLQANNSRHIIHEKVLQVQRLGAEYACNFFNLNHFYAAEDFAEVGRITDDFYRTYRYGGSIEAAAITLTSVMLARATVNKSRQIFKKLQQLGYFRTAAIMRMKSIQESLDVPPEDDAPPIEDLTPQGPTVSLWYVWRTMNDTLVCPICDALDGSEWDFEDPNVDNEMLTPVIDTHPRCRCRIDLERRTVSD